MMCLRSLGLLALATTLLAGCASKLEKIIPCTTSVDHVDFTGVDELRAFIEKAIPIGSSPGCGETVMIGNAMVRSDIHAGQYEGYVDYVYRERRSHARRRLWYWITLTYGERLVCFSYKDGKLYELEVQ